MDVTENNIPENENSDLYKIAYNIVPDGADYDVFSENTKTVNPTLLYNDIPSTRAENVQKNPQSEQKEKIGQDSGGMDYDVFSENADLNPAPAKPINREYLDRLYKDGIEISEDTIRMTRSDYISGYNKICEDYKNAKKECLKDFLWIFVIAVFFTLLYNFLKYLHINIMSVVVTNVLTMAVIACALSSRIICVFLFFSVIKKLSKAKKAKQKSLDRLEQRKQELMVLGLYDLSN